MTMWIACTIRSMSRHLGGLTRSTRTARVAVGEFPGLKIEPGGNAIGGESVNSPGVSMSKS